MPEGHTLHRLAGALDLAFAGTSPAVSSPQGRFLDGAARLNGREVLGADAWGKHLFVEFAGNVFLHVHLGLIGTFDVVPLAPLTTLTTSPLTHPGYAIPPAIGAVRLRLLTGASEAWGSGAAYVADLRGATLCELATPDRVDETVARLGPDPLREDADPEQAWRRIAKSPRSIADLLMDQAVLAGVGNVYRSEILFRHRVDPQRPGRRLRPATWRALWADLLLLMPIGVRLGQIVTMADQVDEALAGGYDESAVPVSPTGVSAWRPNPQGALERRYYVYKRQGEPCHVCGSRVRTALVAGRNLFWCGRCQRRG
ncbi:MAG: zinc finger domain-containing protein [Candidatus Phosphoribacter sp.]|nr:Fpg/Nei family DNA glycosylase [Actinomycetales bacterium]